MNGEKRRRRFDPGRRERIIAATIDVIAEHGIAGTTHRAVAAAAGVPLGSLTYHFAGLDDMLLLAFRRQAAIVQARFRRALAAAATEDIGEAFARIVRDEALHHCRDWSVLLDFYVLARRRSDVWEIAKDWIDSTWHLLKAYFPKTPRSEIDDLVLVLLLRCAPAPGPPDADWIQRATLRLTDSRL